MFHVVNTTIERVPVIIITSDDELSFKIVAVSCIYNFCERLYDGSYEYIQKFYYLTSQGFGNENYFITVSADSYHDALNKIASRINADFSINGYPTRVSVNIDSHGSGAHLDLILPDGDYSSFPKITCETLLLQSLNVDFHTDLYSELLDNSEQFQLAKSFLNDTDPAKELDPNYWTDTQLKFFDFVEKYNKNVISLRSTKKVNANVSGSISQSGQQQEIDLSSLNANTARIANNLQMLDDNHNVKSITKVIDDKNNDQQVVVTTVEKAPYNPLLDDDEF